MRLFAALTVLIVLIACASAVEPYNYTEFHLGVAPGECGHHAFDTAYPLRPRRAIFNGRLAMLGEFPSQVAILKSTENGTLSQHCGGTVVSPFHVVTAAHCLGEVEGMRNGTGDGDLHISFNSLCAVQCEEDDKPEMRRIWKILLPTDFITSNGTSSDIAIISLDKPVAINHACIASNETLSDHLDVVGWGHTRGIKGGVELDKSPSLRMASVRVHERVNGTITAHPGPSDACTGDGGGGLYQLTSAGRRLLVGVVSGGTPGCNGYSGAFGNSQLPTYTDVSHFHPWICEQMKICGADWQWQGESLPTTVLTVSYADNNNDA